MRGGISLKEDEDMSILEVSFHDTLAENRRVPPYRDYNGLDMAALGERVRSCTDTLTSLVHFSMEQA